MRPLTVPAALNAGFAGAALGAKREELALMVNSRNPIVTVETSEELRLSGLLERVGEELGIPLYVWSVTTGLGRFGGAALYNSDQPEQALTTIASIQGDGIFLLKDFCRYCDNDRISRRMRDLADGFRTARRSIVLLGAAIQLPPELEADAVTFQLGLPSVGELVGGVRPTSARLNPPQGIPPSLDPFGVVQLAKNPP